MMVAIGNFFFHYRNMIFPLFYAALFIPSPKIMESHATAAITGLVICLAGQVIRVVTIGLKYIIRGGSKRRVYAKDLVTTGMFSHCRNPLYVGNILVILGLGVVANSLWFLAIMGPFFLFIYQAIVRSEEAFLENKFGDAFRDYMRDVNRWVPNFSGIGDTLRSMEFNWRRVIVKEYNATFIWTVGALAVFMKNRYTSDIDAFNQSVPFAAAGFAILIAAYGTIRWLKKSKRLRAA